MPRKYILHVPVISKSSRANGVQVTFGADGLNWYDYVGGDPLNGTDPLGLSKKLPPPTHYPWPALVGPEITVTGSRCPRGKCYTEVADISGLDRGARSGIVREGFESGSEGVGGDGPQSDTPKCSGVQRAFRATGEFLSEAGSDVALGGVGLGVIGVGVAGVSASTVVLAPGGVLAGGVLATAGGTIAAYGGVSSFVGAGLQIIGGSGKAAIGDVAGRLLTHRLPNGVLKDALQSGIDGAVNAIPFDFQACK